MHFIKMKEVHDCERYIAGVPFLSFNNKLLNLLNLLNTVSLRIVAINTRFYFADVSICYPLSRGISCPWSFAEDEQTYFDVDPRTRRRGRTVRPVAATFAGLQCI